MSLDYFTKLMSFCDPSEKFLLGDNEKIVFSGSRVFWLDFCNERTHKAIEFYGDWWHANPKLGYHEEKIWKHDEKRLELIREARL